jgi:hypothetical protein
MRRTRAPGAGNTRELRVMDVLAEEGWLCASRRHIGGAGDVLAIRSYVDIGSAKGEGIRRPAHRGQVDGWRAVGTLRPR